MIYKSIVFSLLMAIASFASSAKSKIIEAGGPLLDQVPSGQVLAVLPFENTLSSESEAGTSVAEILVNVANSKGVKVVERLQLNKVLEEQSLIASGAVSEENAVEVGELLSAQYLLSGRISELMGERLVSMKLLNAETGEIVDSRNVSLGADAFQSMQKELLGEATQTSAVVFRSAIVPGWGQMYAGKTVRGSIWTSAFVVSAATGIYLTLESNSAYDDYLAYENSLKTSSGIRNDRINFCSTRDCTVEPDGQIKGSSQALTDGFFNEYNDEYKPAQINNKWDTYQDALNNSYVVWGVTGAVWVANLIDAYIVGSERKERLDTYFTALPTLDGGVNLQLGMNF